MYWWENSPSVITIYVMVREVECPVPSTRGPVSRSTGLYLTGPFDLRENCPHPELMLVVGTLQIS